MIKRNADEAKKLDKDVEKFEGNWYIAREWLKNSFSDLVKRSLSVTPPDERETFMYRYGLDEDGEGDQKEEFDEAFRKFDEACDSLCCTAKDASYDAERINVVMSLPHVRRQYFANPKTGTETVRLTPDDDSYRVKDYGEKGEPFDWEEWEKRFFSDIHNTPEDLSASLYIVDSGEYVYLKSGKVADMKKTFYEMKSLGIVSDDENAEKALEGIVGISDRDEDESRYLPQGIDAFMENVKKRYPKGKDLSDGSWVKDVFPDKNKDDGKGGM